MRIRSWIIPFLFLLLCGAIESTWGSTGNLYSCESPLLTHPDQADEREFANLYQCMSALNAHNVTISTLTVTGNLNLTGTYSGTLLGKVIKSTCTTNANSASTTSNVFQATNNTATLAAATSAASDCVFVIANGQCRNNANNVSMFVTLGVGPGGTNQFGSSGQYSFSSQTGGVMIIPCPISGLVCPQSTSSLAYTVQIRNSDNATTVQYGDTNETQSMCLFEITYP